jgi:hypothetical protein
LPVFASSAVSTPVFPFRKYRMPSYSSGEGTYGVSRSIDQTSAGASVTSPFASARRMALRLLPRKPDIR